jgi:hypothetical protein
VVHDRRLQGGFVRVAAEDPARARGRRFQEARGTQFPHAYPVGTGAEPRRFTWWCPDCQRARAEYFGDTAGADPHAVLDQARDLAREGRYPEALERHLWFHEHALDYRPSLSGVRLSFALGDWLRLGERYPPARDALVAVRDRTAAAMTAGNWTARGFQDVAAINHQLGEEAETGALFLNLRQADPALAVLIARDAEEGLIARREYAVLGEYLADPVGHFNWFAARLMLASARHARSDPEAARAWAQGPAGERLALLVEVLERAGRTADAERLRAAAANHWPVAATHRIVARVPGTG